MEVCPRTEIRGAELRSGWRICLELSTGRLAAAIILSALFLLLTSISMVQAAQYLLPLVTPDGALQQGFVRISIHSDSAGTVQIYGIDDEGQFYGPVTLRLDEKASRHVTSRDLEEGNVSNGLSGSLGNGDGYWRLRLESDLDIEVGAYVRTADGFVASVHDVVRTVMVEDETVHRVPIFKPGSSRDQVSWLRIINLTNDGVDVTIRGRDDAGEPPLGGEVRLTLPAGGAQRISAQQLEAGDAGITGSFGDGEGNWQLLVSADGAIKVLSLLESRTGYVTNLSASGLQQASIPGGAQLKSIGSRFRDCAACPEMVVVPEGSFTMGSPLEELDRHSDEGPAHQVTISDPFAVGRYELTFAEWDACYEAGGCSHDPNDGGWGRGNRPVVEVSWNDAQEYVTWLSATTGFQYRLLSESEWEYVARAGTATRYWWGDDIGDNLANCHRCGSPWDIRQTAPVGSFAPNEFGIHDVHGNVWERVQDCWNESYEGTPVDGSAWESEQCNAYVVRGGGWATQTPFLRAANRLRISRADSRSFYDFDVGFRVARAVTTTAQHSLPLFLAAGSVRQSIARIINLSDRAGTVRIYGIDDSGHQHGPVELSLGATATRHFSSIDLEQGNMANGLVGSLGDGQGNWRLELSTDLEIEPSAYVRAHDGFLAPMHDVVRQENVANATIHTVPLFYPASHPHQVSLLRIANTTNSIAHITIQGQDDAGQPAPTGEVHLTLAPGAARFISAQQLESGGTEITGSFGEGRGHWQLSISSDRNIQVVSLTQTPTRHLANLSTTLTGERSEQSKAFTIAGDGKATTRPLETIALTVSPGLTDSSYSVLLDISGNDTFDEDETIDVPGVTTDEDQILFASPLAQVFPDQNTALTFAVRVRRQSDGEFSNELSFALADISIPTDESGYPTIALEALLKSIYLSTDDPLLRSEAIATRPGLLVSSAHKLGMDTKFSDIQAAAILQSVFGIDVLGASSTPSAGGRTVQALRSSSTFIEDTYTHDKAVPLLSAPVSLSTFADPFEGLLTCVKDAFRSFGGNTIDQAKQDACVARGVHDNIKAHINNFEIARAISVIPTLGRSIWKKVAATFVDESASEGVKQTILIVKNIRDTSNLARLLKKSDIGDLPDIVQGALTTANGLTNIHSSLSEFVNEASNGMPDLIRRAESYYTTQGINDEAREALSLITNEADRQQDYANTIESLKRVFTGEEEPLEAMMDQPGLARKVDAMCAAGYEEFPIDEETSTCVFHSLVERSCYAGSRQPSEVDLGGSDACLYYSLDFFQRNGTCRENYAKVHYNGRWTCRWTDLGPSQPHWYTLDKTYEAKVVVCSRSYSLLGGGGGRICSVYSSATEDISSQQVVCEQNGYTVLSGSRCPQGALTVCSGVLVGFDLTYTHNYYDEQFDCQ